MATINSIQDILDSPDDLRAFQALPETAQTEVLGSLSPLFQSGSSEARQELMQFIGQQSTTIPLRDVPAQAIQNFPESIVNLGSDIAQAVASPIETGKALGKVAVGGVQQLIPGEQPQEESFNQMVEFFKDRFGGVENLKRTIAEDPAGFLADVSTFATGGGGVLAGVAKVGGRTGQIAKTGQRIAKAAELADPIALVTRGAAAGVRRFTGPNSVRSLIKSAVKFPEGGSRVTENNILTNVDAMADEFIARGLRPTREARNLLGDQIKGIQNQVSDIISEGERQGIRIPMKDVTAGLDSLIDELEGISGLESPAGIKSVKRFRDDLIKKRTVGVGQALRGEKPFMTPIEVQNLKKLLNKSFAPSIEASVDAVRRVAKEKIRIGTKQILETQFPQLKQLNPDQQVSINLQEAISKTIRLAEKEKTFSVPGLAIGMGVGGVVGGSMQSAALGITSATLAFIASKVLANPRVQVELSKAVNIADKIALVGGALGRTTPAAFQAGRLQEELQTQ